MDLDTVIITIYCHLDDALCGVLGTQRLRQRGPAPRLADSEVLTMEVVGASLGLDQDTALYAYFRRHYPHFFPAIAQVDRTTFVCHAATLWAMKEQIWQSLLPQVPADSLCGIVDSVPIPVCRFARARTCRRFRGAATFGRDPIAKQTFYGFKLHVRISWPGLLTHLCLAPANTAEVEVAPLLTTATRGVLLGDRGYWAPRLRHDLAGDGIDLQAPFMLASRDPWPDRSALISRLRERVDVVFGQLTSPGRSSPSGLATSGTSAIGSCGPSSATLSRCSLPASVTFLPCSSLTCSPTTKPAHRGSLEL